MTTGSAVTPAPVVIRQRHWFNVLPSLSLEDILRESMAKDKELAKDIHDGLVREFRSTISKPRVYNQPVSVKAKALLIYMHRLGIKSDHDFLADCFRFGEWTTFDWILEHATSLIRPDNLQELAPYIDAIDDETRAAKVTQLVSRLKTRNAVEIALLDHDDEDEDVDVASATVPIKRSRSN